MTSKTATIYDWVDERLGLSELAAFARHKTVPVHAQSFWYYWGGISLFLFLVQCFTGVLLLVYFRPDPNRGVSSPDHFCDALRMADPLRAHAWSANLMMFPSSCICSRSSL
jgi:cytochrome b6